MYAKAVLPVFISILTIIISSTSLRATSLEEKYFQTRDHFIQQFQEATNPINESPALAELETQLRTIVGHIDIEGFPQQGKINVRLLQSEAGLAQVEGLRFDAAQESLFVTTEDLLQYYLSEHPNLPKDFSELSKTGDFYRRVFHSDAGVAYYAEIPVKSPETQSFIFAFLGVSAQDIGPFIPNEIFVFVSTEKKILLANAPATVEITDIPQCKNEWEKFNQKSSEAYEMYQSTEFKDKKVFNDFLRYEQKGFETYLHCFEREARNQLFFESLKKQAQSLVDRLQRNEIENYDTRE